MSTEKKLCLVKKNHFPILYILTLMDLLLHLIAFLIKLDMLTVSMEVLVFAIFCLHFSARENHSCLLFISKESLLFNWSSTVLMSQRMFIFIHTGLSLMTSNINKLNISYTLLFNSKESKLVSVFFLLKLKYLRTAALIPVKYCIKN